MKKWMTIIICAVLFMGCGPEEDQAGENVGLEIKTEVYEQDDIVIQYPQIYGMGDEDREKKINELIQNHVSEMGYFDPEVSITEDGTRWEWHLEKQMEYEVTFLDEHMISILYQGESKLYSVRDEYRFNYCVDAYTIDLNEMEELELSDFVEIDEGIMHFLESVQYGLLVSCHTAFVGGLLGFQLGTVLSDGEKRGHQVADRIGVGRFEKCLQIIAFHA